MAQENSPDKEKRQSPPLVSIPILLILHFLHIRLFPTCQWFYYTHFVIITQRVSMGKYKYSYECLEFIS